MAKWIFFLSFLLVGAIFFTAFEKSGIVSDSDMWANQARYFQDGDARQFDFLAAYGHPGGTLIEGTLAVHNLSDASYMTSLYIFIALMGALFAGGATSICYLLTKNYLACLATLALLISNRAYTWSTPPSLLVSLSLLFLSFLTVFIFREEKAANKSMAVWGLVAGFSIATRADVGGILALALFISLCQKFSLRKMLTSAVTAGLSFILFDPFMWSMPLRHLGDLIYKATYHYTAFDAFYTAPLSGLTVVGFSLLSFISMGIGAFLVLGKGPAYLNKVFLSCLLVATALLYNIFLTSRFQTQRYFEPLMVIWEGLLPLLIFALTLKINPSGDFSLLPKIEGSSALMKIVSLAAFIVIILLSYYVLIIWSDFIHDLGLTL